MDRNDSTKQAKAEMDWAAEQSQNDKMRDKMAAQKKEEDAIDRAVMSPESQADTEAKESLQDSQLKAHVAKMEAIDKAPPIPAPIYTYHACFNINIQGPPIVADMILTLSEPITEANYSALKTKIAEIRGYRDGNVITITSLTCI